MGDVIKEGYKVLVTDEEGTVLDSIPLGGYNLDKPIARSSLVYDIKDALPTEAFDPPGEEVPRKELNKFALKLVAGLRGQAEGLVSSPQYKGWTKEELRGTADLILEDLRQSNKEAIEALQKLYQETGGEPFKEEYYGG